MKTTFEIIEMVRDGEQPEYDDLIYTICAMSALSTFDNQALMKLAIAEMEGEIERPKNFTHSPLWQYEEHFTRNKKAYDKPPKDFVGWNNDPNNPEFIERRKQSKKLVDKILKKVEIT